MRLKLHTAPGTIGLATHIALEESGLAYELVEVDFGASEQTGAAYRAINPKARVPSLVVDGTVLTETPALLVCIAQLAPASSLRLPDDPVAFAGVQAFNSYLCSTVHVAHAHKRRGRRWTDDEGAIAALTAAVPATMAACFEAIEADHLEGPWVKGERFGICDAYLHAITEWLEGDGVDIGRFPKVEAHRALMRERTSVRAIAAARTRR